MAFKLIINYIRFFQTDFKKMNLYLEFKLIKPKLKLIDMKRYLTNVSSLSRQNNNNSNNLSGSGNKNRLMLMDIPRSKFPNPFGLIELRLRIFFQMLQIDKSFGLENFMNGAEQVKLKLLII